VREGAARVAFCGKKKERTKGELERARTRGTVNEKKETYRDAEKAFILHTNCFAEHFVFE